MQKTDFITKIMVYMTRAAYNFSALLQYSLIKKEEATKFLCSIFISIAILVLFSLYLIQTVQSVLVGLFCSFLVWCVYFMVHIYKIQTRSKESMQYSIGIDVFLCLFILFQIYLVSPQIVVSVEKGSNITNLDYVVIDSLKIENGGQIISAAKLIPEKESNGVLFLICVVMAVSLVFKNRIDMTLKRDALISGNDTHYKDLVERIESTVIAQNSVDRQTASYTKKEFANTARKEPIKEAVKHPLNEDLLGGFGSFKPKK